MEHFDGEPGQIDPEQVDFDRQLRQALERRPAPLSLKRNVMERRQRVKAERAHLRLLWLERLAATIILAAILGGALLWRNVEQRRKGEAAREQVLTALRIASHALNQMNQQLNNSNRSEQ